MLGLLVVSSCALVLSFDDREHAPRSLEGTVSGLEDATVVLALDDERLDAGNGPFTFPPILAYGSTYSLTIAAQPREHHCSIRGGQGDVAGYDVAGVEVRCNVERPSTCDAGDAGADAGCL